MANLLTPPPGKLIMNGPLYCGQSTNVGGGAGRLLSPETGNRARNPQRDVKQHQRDIAQTGLGGYPVSQIKDGRLRSVPTLIPTPGQWLDSVSGSDSTIQKYVDSDSGSDSSCQKKVDSDSDSDSS